MATEPEPMEVKFSPTIVVGMTPVLDPETIDLFDKTRYWVEAGDNDMQAAWQRLSLEGRQLDTDKGRIRYTWIETNHIKQLQIGKYGDAPLTIKIRWAMVNDLMIAFYGSDAYVIDYRMMEHFLLLSSRSFRCGLHCDADTFGFRIHGMHDEVKRFEYANALIVLAKRKQEEEQDDDSETKYTKKKE